MTCPNIRQPEFLAGVRYYQGDRSPNTAEREANGYSLAWMHHKGRNRHHFEYWTDLSPKTRTYEPVDMPVRYLCEMVADRIAACKTYQGAAYTDASPLQYLDRANESRARAPADHEATALSAHDARRTRREGDVPLPARGRSERGTVRRGTADTVTH